MRQQYDAITHSRRVEITGQAIAGATVELTLDGGTPFTVDRTLPQHQTGDPHSFRYVHEAPGTDARWLHVRIKASAGGIEVVRDGFVYVPPATETLLHDADGNLTSTAQWEYTWDAENRMTSATQSLLPCIAGVTPPVRKRLEFAYDYKNRRIAKKVYVEESGTGLQPVSWRLTKDLRFVYDGWQMIAELDASTATGTGLAGSRVNRTFLWGEDVSGTMTGAGGVGGLLSTTYQGVTYHVCSDANGNVTGLVPANGPDAGKLVARYDYDPFGNRITNTGPDVELCPFGFSTKYTDSETGIVNYELRPYQPPLGRFLSRDPIEEEGGINLYGFVGNDPVNKWDYLGLASNAEPKWYTSREAVASWGGEPGFGLPPPLPGVDNTGPYQLGWEWLTGAGPAHRKFGPGSMMISYLKIHQHVNDIRREVQVQIKRHCECDEKKSILLWPYSVGGPEGVLLYLRDYSELIKDGLARVIDRDRKVDGPVVVAYLGSFGAKVYLSKVDCDDEQGGVHEAKLRFQVWNKSNVQSATHLPILGYTSAWQRGVEPTIGNLHDKYAPTNNETGRKAGGETRQDFIWDESLQIRASY